MTEITERDDRSLDVLADEINEEHRQAEAAMTEALVHARNAGRGLNAAKDQTEHGEWGDWVRDNFEGSERTARVYQRIARNWTKIENRQRDADLSIRGAVRLLRDGDSADAGSEETEEREPGRVEAGEAIYLRFPEWAVGVDYGWIWPATEEGFFWLVFMESHPDGSGTTRFWWRPMSAEGIEVVFDTLRIPGDEAIWTSLGQSEPKDYNPFIFSSREEQTARWIKSWKDPGNKTDRAMRRRRAARKGFDY